MERKVNSKYYIENIEKAIFDNQTALPNSIPLSQGFVGRKDYLDDLRESYQNGTRCFVLHGIGGVGKSSLALKFAGEIAGDYVAKIFVNMQGMSKNPLSAQDAMFEIVRGFKPEISDNIDGLQLRNDFVQFVQNQRTLIVIDNAANIESVESLMQAKACLIITSRQSFVLTGDKKVKIAKMSPDDARELLFNVLKNSGGERRFDGRADELAYLSGYLPMALKVLAGLLANDDLETVAKLIKKYSDQQILLKERVPDYEGLTIEASFELSYEALPEIMKERWRRLSVFPSSFSDVPSDFTHWALAFVLEISENEAEETQKFLRKYNLLEADTKTNRFYLHDLARVFVETKLSESERFNTEHLHAIFYEALLSSTIPMVKSLRQDGLIMAVNVINLEWINIEAGQKWTAYFTDKDNEAADLCRSYAEAISGPLGEILKPREVVRWLKDALKAVRKTGDKMTEGIILGNLGKAYFTLEDFPQAIKYYEIALENTPQKVYEITHPQIKDEWLFYLGVSYFKLNKKEKACSL